jgi:exodeoxyribonuclease VII large subunit
VQEPLFVDEPTLSVADVSAGIAGALARAFPNEVWVRGEIADLSRAASGHVYFTLTGEGACIAVTLFASERVVVNQVLRRAGGAVRMTDGTEVRIRARLSWFARRGSVQLRMLSIDPAYTLGRLAEARERLVRALEVDGLLRRQATLVIPDVPLRVGLVTSEGSAAAADFVETLTVSGYAFRVFLADARVQGVDAEGSVCAALRALVERPDRPDVICIVRGGGARTDLAAFDGESVARAIAACVVPVLTGIGHEVDTSVADLVAHTAHKTPTACAGALVERVRAHLTATTLAWDRVARVVTSRLRGADQRLDDDRRRLLDRGPLALDRAARHVDHLAARVAAADPTQLLRRGWSITRTDAGTVVRSVDDVVDGTQLVTTLADGEVHSEVRSGAR